MSERENQGASGDSSEANDPVRHRDPGPKNNWFTRLGSVLPTLIVFIALAAIGFWGHSNGWKFPRFSEILHGKQSRDDDWCDEHSVPESECVQCGNSGCCVSGISDDPSDGQQKDYGWCWVHGIHQCPHCHPDVAQTKQEPDSSPAETQRIKHAMDLRLRPENNSNCTQYQNVIQFASIDSVRKAGVDVQPAQRRKIIETVPVNAVISYDQTRIAELAGRAPGIVVWADNSIGDQVHAGDVLALIDASAVGQAKGELQKALSQLSFHRATLRRVSPLAAEGVIPEKRLLEAQRELNAAEVNVINMHQKLVNLGFELDVEQLESLDQKDVTNFLRFLGIPQSIQQEISGKATTSNLLPIRASINGIITDRHAVKGEVVDATQILFEIVDTSEMWLNLNIPIEESSLVKPDQTVLFRPDGSSERYQGKISWISSSIDRTTRTLSARAVIGNQDGKLRNEMFGAGELVLREDPQAVLVPRTALQRDGTCYVVFVRDKHYITRKTGPKLFYTRSVRTGAVLDDEIEIIAGLLPGEVVATIGSDVLRGQLLKSDLGAG